MTNKTQVVKSQKMFPVVGVGASAGGLDAFKLFISNIQRDSGMAYVLVQHLDPVHQSLLPELITKSSVIPVKEITNNMQLSKDCIFVLPPNKRLKIENGKFKTIARKTRESELPIDRFFISLAEQYKAFAVGVVLSGSASDGTIGLKAIQDNEGLTLAQEPNSATFSDMPKNAINAKVVDYVLVPQMMPSQIHSIMTRNISDKDDLSNTPKKDEGFFRDIIHLLSAQTGVDFDFYKQSMLKRRITRRVMLSNSRSIQSYIKRITSNKHELELLFEDVLLPVTSFFRDKEVFNFLQETIIPHIIKNTLTATIRIWVAGCSTGEEAYTMAMLFSEVQKGIGDKVKIQIFASDISKNAINQARLGFYNDIQVRNLNPKLLNKYFTKMSGGYQINHELREMCVFAEHNFLKDPPFGHIDLVSCRNVLIYMDTYLQRRAFNAFHFSLNSNGFLLLGRSETTGPSGLFSAYSKDSKVFTPKALSKRSYNIGNPFPVSSNEGTNVLRTTSDVHKVEFLKSAEKILLTQYAPPSVIIDANLDVIHINGNIAPYFETPQGKPSYNIIKMARPPLDFVLRSMLLKSKSQKDKIVKKDISLTYDGRKMLVEIEVLPIFPNEGDNYKLVILKKTEIEEIKFKTGKSTRIQKDKKWIEIIDKLEKELIQNREDIRIISEDQETANNEVQASNEELLSSNEELQSLNEELETSKEELQSINEELIIVNQEMFDKQLQVNNSRLFAEAIINTIKKPLVVLDNTFVIKYINLAFCHQFKINSEEGIGEYFTSIINNLFNTAEIKRLLMKVLPKKAQIVDHELIVNIHGLGHLEMLFNACHLIIEKKGEQLILITFENIHVKTSLEQSAKLHLANLLATIKELNKSIDQKNIQLSQFAHTASHELQEPLRKILTYAKILTSTYNGNKSAVFKENLDKIQISSKRLSELIKDLLTFASASHHKSLHTNTDLNEILNNVITDFELLIKDKKARIISENLPHVVAIPFEMHQLFYELISNSIKFTKSGIRPVIDISAVVLSSGQIKSLPQLDKKLKYYDIIFKDNGIGFEQKYAQQIFTAFQRLDSTDIYAGTGIGLSLCKKILDNCNGIIYAQSDNKTGSIFHVIIPKIIKEKVKISLN
jgi:two-component system CheB/CheR fusion protein